MLCLFHVNHKQHPLYLYLLTTFKMERQGNFYACYKVLSYIYIYISIIPKDLYDFHVPLHSSSFFFVTENLGKGEAIPTLRARAYPRLFHQNLQRNLQIAHQAKNYWQQKSNLDWSSTKNLSISSQPISCWPLPFFGYKKIEFYLFIYNFDVFMCPAPQNPIYIDTENRVANKIGGRVRKTRYDVSVRLPVVIIVITTATPLCPTDYSLPPQLGRQFKPPI